jgi:hypothetical protein
MLVLAALCSSIGMGVRAQEPVWKVGAHPDYHVAMVKQVDDVIVAIYVSKEPAIYASPLILETVLAPCSEEKPLSMHVNEAIFAFGKTSEDRKAEVRLTLESFFESGKKKCILADDIDVRFFRRFDEAYAAADEILVEAGVFPLTDPDADLEERSEDDD